VTYEYHSAPFGMNVTYGTTPTVGTYIPPVIVEGVALVPGDWVFRKWRYVRVGGVAPQRLTRRRRALYRALHPRPPKPKCNGVYTVTATGDLREP
jgi:hypothetical protein